MELDLTGNLRTALRRAALAELRETWRDYRSHEAGDSALRIGEASRVAQIFGASWVDLYHAVDVDS